MSGLPIISADQRLAEPRGIKGCIFGVSGIGKTSLLWTLNASTTLFMDLEAGDMQFVNNYHVLHARTAYEDDRAAGRVRHLKRLWLETRALEQRPSFFASNPASHWATQRSASHIQTA